MLHHVELWVPDLHRALASFGWLLEALGYALFQSWEGGAVGGSGRATWSSNSRRPSLPKCTTAAAQG